MVCRDVRDLVALSRAVGADERLVQGGGGNTSVKSADGRLVYVKASGTPLKRMSARRGLRALRLQAVRDLLEDGEVSRLAPVRRDAVVRRRLLAACVDERPGHPSVETLLHAFLGRYVVHVHPAATNGLLCAREGRVALEDLFGGEAPVLYVGWRIPGMPLARGVWRAVRRFEREHGASPALIFLQNHGLFASADSPGRAVAAVRRVEAKVRALWRTRCRAAAATGHREAPPGVVRGMRRVLRQVWADWLPGDLLVGFVARGPSRELAGRPDAADLLRAGALTPDQLAYAHGAPLWVDPGQGLERVRRALVRRIEARMRHQAGPPRAVVARDMGLFVVEQSRRPLEMARAISAASLESLLVAADFGGPRGIGRKAAAYIEGWEYEVFRRRVATGEAPGV